MIEYGYVAFDTVIYQKGDIRVSLVMNPLLITTFTIVY